MAYREAPTKNKHDVKRYYSWFTWQKCEVCEREFRREKGYVYKTLRWVSFEVNEYICSSCGSNSQDFVYVNQYIDYMKHGRKPKTHPLHSPPPAPPMRQIPSGGF